MFPIYLCWIIALAIVIERMIEAAWRKRYSSMEARRDANSRRLGIEDFIFETQSLKIP